MSAGKPRAERLVAHDVITKGWMSPAYKEFREYAPGLCADKTEGYVTLLELVFDELALDLPGLYGNVGLTRLFPIPPATLRSVIEALNDKALDTAWTDDTTLGWVYGGVAASEQPGPPVAVYLQEAWLDSGCGERSRGSGRAASGVAGVKG
jgi:hypothetical protein